MEALDHAATVLIQHWDINRFLIRAHAARDGCVPHDRFSADAALDADDKREMLRRLAFRMQAGKGGLAGNYVHRDDLKQEFATYLKERHDFEPILAKSVAEVMLLQFQERNFILSLYGAHLYGFVHRAFLEYFCATAFLDQFEKAQKLSFEALLADVFDAHWSDQSWHEVLRLICGSAGTAFHRARN